jgi:membrane associated rhomboid family serine protease
MAAGLAAWLRSARDPLTALVAVLFAAKLAWEHFAGALPFTSALLSLPVVHEAHTYGALGGLVAALLINRQRRPGAPSL